MTRSRVPRVFPTMHAMAEDLEEGLPARDVSWEEALRAPFDSLAAGDAAALEAIWNLSSQRLYGLALWRTGREEDARDVVQEVFVRLASRRGELRGVEKPLVWLLAVTHNAAIDAVRRNARRRTEPLGSAAHVAAPAADPERSAAASQTSRALSELSAPQREAVLLHHIAGCSFREIAAITGVPAFTAASRCRLAIARLRQLMGGPR
ncbi:MAG: RNA polymerase sigma factor [Thermoanaerobaculia bacterium]